VKQIVTNSEESCFDQCPAKWGFRYADGLRPVSPEIAPSMGTILHAALEAALPVAYKPPIGTVGEAILAGMAAAVAEADAFVERVTQAGLPPELEESVVDEARAFVPVVNWHLENFFRQTYARDSQLQLLAVERSFEVPLLDPRGRPNGRYRQGKIDAIWYDPQTKALLVDDHKSVGHDVNSVERRLFLDNQMTGYLYAVGQMAKRGGLDVPKDAVGATVRYNVFRRAAPKSPKVNKVRKNDGAHDVTADLARLEGVDGVARGLVSVAACDTTAEIYCAAIDEQFIARGLPPTAEQVERLRQLKESPNAYFVRIEHYRTAEEVNRWRTEAWVKAQRIRAAEKDPSLRTRSPVSCTMGSSPRCAYQPVCVQDAPETRALYRVATTKHEEVGNVSNGNE
jgi:hypothetical protein